jgi:hypothetical protein
MSEEPQPEHPVASLIKKRMGSVPIDHGVSGLEAQAQESFGGRLSDSKLEHRRKYRKLSNRSLSLFLCFSFRNTQTHTHIHTLLHLSFSISLYQSSKGTKIQSTVSAQQSNLWPPNSSKPPNPHM